MTEHVLKAWQVDIDGRTSGINQHNATGYKVNAHEIAPGVIYRDRNVHGDGVFRCGTRRWSIPSASGSTRRTAAS